MKITYYLKYAKFARDYKSAGFAKLIPKNGPLRTKEWRRYRIVLNQRNEAIDYKDLLVILGPQNIKGLSILTWTYIDRRKTRKYGYGSPVLERYAGCPNLKKQIHF